MSVLRKLAGQTAIYGLSSIVARFSYNFTPNRTQMTRILRINADMKTEGAISGIIMIRVISVPPLSVLRKLAGQTAIHGLCSNLAMFRGAFAGSLSTFAFMEKRKAIFRGE